MIRTKMLQVLGVMALLGLGMATGPALPQNEAGPSTAPSTTGVVMGKVTFEGKRPRVPTLSMEQDPVCAAAHKDPVFPEDGAVSPDGDLPNAFVYLKEGTEKLKFSPPPTPVTLDQRGCMYQPHVLGIMVGQELRIVSSDPTTHNVHPMPKNNREWNQSQPPGAPPLVRKFLRPEVAIPVKCNQHPWMRTYIAVTRNPFFAVTGSDGAFTIRGIPPGEYMVDVWTATFGTQEQKVTVRPNDSTQVTFTFKSH